MRLMSIAICFGFVLSLSSSLQAQAPGAATKNPVVALETSKGTIKIELYPEKALKQSKTSSITSRRSTTMAPFSIV